ncbi:hypothetical protein DYY66_1071 [Candidatus Nitrosotalea sp. FS]|uniref:hypothetical protein n=1 Tax=Candidatus Nitrosotalea sp. FS TaxID=2341021 RepID=UPI00140832D6|nr:hypothetical protein [Candidatus Nitrosotalea sp. FS]NHH98153.1 hypothetical protein [Candidatus Nitrosotalea sp. FS]
MKLLLGITIALVLMVSFSNSYAQTPQNNIAIHVQIKVENSDGALVSYLETDKVIITDYASLNSLLDTNAPILHKKIVMFGDQKYELIKATDVLVHTSPTIVSENFVSADSGNSHEILALADHDGYPVVKGDKVTTYWTILRPAS